MERVLDWIAYFVTGFGLVTTTIIIPLALSAPELPTCGANSVGWLAILHWTRPRPRARPDFTSRRALHFSNSG